MLRTPDQHTVGGLARALAERFRQAGIDNGMLDARILLAHGLGWTRPQLVANNQQTLTQSQIAAVEQLAIRRESREPLSHITGEREFWGLPFVVNRHVLDPRADSETLITLAQDIFTDTARALDVIDLGTGSGCLLLTILALYPAARGLGIDASKDALTVAHQNAQRLELSERAAFIWGDWARDLAPDCCDLVLCNPPYIPSQDCHQLMPEVARFEPRGALDGGADGLDCYRELLPQISRILRPGGVALLEIGIDQVDAVTGLVSANGLTLIQKRNDLAGIPRALAIRLEG